MDDILLAGLIANVESPADYMIVGRVAVAVEPNGIMIRKDDPAFKKMVDDGDRGDHQDAARSTRSTTSGSLSPIPPKGINLNCPMSDALKKAIRQSRTTSGDPAKYK